MSQNQEETPEPLTCQQKQTKTRTNAKKKEGQTTVLTSHADKRENDISLCKIANCSSNSEPVRPRVFSQKKSSSPSDPEGKLQFSLSQSDQEGLNNEDQLKMKQMFGRQLLAKQGLWAGINVAETHERKLQKELRKLSEQSRPSRDRLAVFSDVFDDVCEGSPVFGRILREIKTDYDLYVNHLMDSQSQSLNTSPEHLRSGKEREMELEDAEKEVCRLEQEVRGALEEKRRVQNELQKVIKGPEESDLKNPVLSGLGDRGTVISCTDTVQSKRLQVLNTCKEIQQLEEEIQQKLVSAVTTTATERHTKHVKTEIMRLIASNDCLKSANKDLEESIHKVLNREKASKATRRMLWEDIHCDLQTE